MSHRNATRLRGLMTAILTPFDLQGNLALHHYPALLDFQRQGGVDGVIVCGTNGEGTSLSVAERKQALETVLTHRGDLTVVAATGAASLTDALELTRHAAEAGADGTLLLPPFFFKKPSAAGVADYFRAVLDVADLPALLYNIPQFSAVTVTDDVLHLLADHPNLSGIKDSTGDWSNTYHYLTHYPELRIFAGSDRLASLSFAQGAGSISGGANAFPEAVAAIRDSVAQKKPDGEQAQSHMNTLLGITTRYPLIAVSKSILAHRGLPRLGVRAPLVNLTPAQESILISDSPQQVVSPDNLL